MSKRRRYKNPPIEEALCEFRFEPGMGWDPTIPGKLQVELGNEYTGKPRQERLVEVELGSKEGSPPNLRLHEGLEKVQLVKENGKRMVGIGPDILSIHMLHPYQDTSNPQASGWDEFEPRISAALAAYRSISEPTGVRRIGVRYINKIIIPQKSVRIEDYLRCALPDISGLPDRLNNFMSRIDCVYEDGVHLVLSQGPVNAPLDHVAFLLDLDVIWESSEPLALDKALERVNDLRVREREAFETVITDKARELFDAN